MFDGFKPIPINEHAADFAASAFEITLDDINYRVCFPSMNIPICGSVRYVTLAFTQDPYTIHSFAC